MIHKLIVKKKREIAGISPACWGICVKICAQSNVFKDTNTPSGTAMNLSASRPMNVWVNHLHAEETGTVYPFTLSQNMSVQIPRREITAPAA